MGTTRVKICGMTRAEDAVAAAELGADAVGLNFFAGPRRITMRAAAQILNELPPLVMPVALTGGDLAANADYPSIEDLLAGEEGQRPITTFQVYGREHPMGFWSPKVERFTWWCVVRVGSKEDIAGACEFMDLYELNPPGAVLFDAAVKGQEGGSGKTFEWQWIAEAREKGLFAEMPQVILAGGLTPENVAEAIRIVRPWAVDVSSGVEVEGKPGVKDRLKMRDFIQAAKGAM